MSQHFLSYWPTFPEKDMRIKRAEVPVEPYILKFAQWEFQTAGTVRVANRIMFPYSHKATHWRMYFYRKHESTMDVEMHDPSLRNQFYLVRYLDQLFKWKMHTYIEAQVSVGIKAKHAAQFFLYTVLDLQEHEYKVDRAYKSWHRYRKRTKHHRHVFLLAS
jgi:hypothetical protein